MLPALAAYMGQIGLGSTTRYLALTPERFRAQLKLLSPGRRKRHWRDDTELMRFLEQLDRGKREAAASWGSRNEGRMFEGIFTRSEQIALHQQAPLLTEREDYLRYLHRQEYGYSSLYRVASLLVPIVQFLALNELRVIGMAELRQAADAWSATQQREGSDIASQSRRAESFLVVARAVAALPWKADSSRPSLSERDRGVH